MSDVEVPLKGPITVTQADIEKAICLSEVAGSGHAGGIPCEWHTVEGSERVRRFVYALANPKELEDDEDGP